MKPAVFPEASMAPAAASTTKVSDVAASQNATTSSVAAKISVPLLAFELVFHGLMTSSLGMFITATAFLDSFVYKNLPVDSGMFAFLPVLAAGSYSLYLIHLMVKIQKTAANSRAAFPPERAAASLKGDASSFSPRSGQSSESAGGKLLPEAERLLAKWVSWETGRCSCWLRREKRWQKGCLRVVPIPTSRFNTWRFFHFVPAFYGVGAFFVMGTFWMMNVHMITGEVYGKSSRDYYKYFAGVNVIVWTLSLFWFHRLQKKVLVVLEQPVGSRAPDETTSSLSVTETTRTGGSGDGADIV